MRKLFATAFFICAFSLQAFPQDKYEEFRKELSAKLELLSLYTCMVYEEDYNAIAELDPDSLSRVIAADITAYIKDEGLRHFNRDDFDSIDIQVPETDSTFMVFTIGYNSGGTAGWIPHPVIVRQDGEKLKVFDLSDIECFFYDFYRLRDEIYLCLGSVPGWGACANNGIFIIDFGGEEVEFVPAFNGKYHLSVCNSDISFDRIHGILSIDIYDLYSDNEEADCRTYLNQFNQGFGSFSIECYTDSDDMQEQESMTAIITSIFDGEKFVKPESADGE